MSLRQFHIYGEEGYPACMSQLGSPWQQGGVLYLSGSLGAGKTTWMRYLLRALGYEGVVRSPTYTLFEVYDLSQLTVVHVDCYRMQGNHEVALSGLDQYLDQALCCFEWPQLVEEALPNPSWSIHLDYLLGGQGRCVFYQDYTQST